MDRDGRGLISLGDLRRGLSTLSPDLLLSDTSLIAFFKRFDLDGDLGLKFSELSLAFDPLLDSDLSDEIFSRKPQIDLT